MKRCDRCKGAKYFLHVRANLPTPGHPGRRGNERLLFSGFNWWSCPSCNCKWKFVAFGQGDEEGDPLKLEGMTNEYDSVIATYPKQAQQLHNGIFPI